MEDKPWWQDQHLAQHDLCRRVTIGSEEQFRDVETSWLCTFATTSLFFEPSPRLSPEITGHGNTSWLNEGAAVHDLTVYCGFGEDMWKKTGNYTYAYCGTAESRQFRRNETDGSICAFHLYKRWGDNPLYDACHQGCLWLLVVALTECSTCCRNTEQ